MGGIEEEITSITDKINELSNQISNLSTSSSGAGSNGFTSDSSTTVGKVNSDTSFSDADMTQAKKNEVSRIVSDMRTLSVQWHTADPATKKQLAEDCFKMGKSLITYGVDAERDDNSGTWYIKQDDLNPSNVGKRLYSCYHTGGFVGDEPLQPDEEYIKAKDGELMLTSNQQDSIVGQIDRIEKIGDALSDSVGDAPISSKSLWSHGVAGDTGGTVNNVTNNSQPTIQITETITCVPEKSVEKHQKLNRDMLNEIARQIRKP